MNNTTQTAVDGPVVQLTIRVINKCAKTNRFDRPRFDHIVHMCTGFVQEKTLFRSNELMPKLKRRINDDLSTSPTPYRLLKQMLISPGMLSGYSFHAEPQGSLELLYAILFC